MNYLEEYKKKNQERLRGWLKDAGIAVEALSDDQVDLIHEPNEAPENFHCDGEVSVKQAALLWIKRMRRAEIPTLVIKQAIEYNFKH